MSGRSSEGCSCPPTSARLGVKRVLHRIALAIRDPCEASRTEGASCATTRRTLRLPHEVLDFEHEALVV